AGTDRPSPTRRHQVRALWSYGDPRGTATPGGGRPMSGTADWEWKLREAAERLRTRYDHIGRKTGAPFLAVVYPPDVERSVLREWRTLAATLQPEFSVRTIDVLGVTSGVIDRFGAGTLVDAMSDPMPGSDPASELGSMWTNAVADSVRNAIT